MSELTYKTPSPVGTIEFRLNSDGALTRLGFGGAARSAPASGASTPPAAGRVLEQLEAYFAGVLQTFDLPIEPSGTPFQLEVWHEVRSIPYGRTTTYGEIATRMHRLNGQRAVGAANGANPIAIIIPCHRVIGVDGALTGYAGGLEIKRALLHLEGALPAETGRLF